MVLHRLRCFRNAAAIMVVLAGAAGGSPAPAEVVLKVGGTGSALGTMRLLGVAFEKSNPGIKVQVQPSIGSSGAIRAVSKGALDIGLTSRPLAEDEQDPHLRVIDYAKTPFILVAWRSVPAEGLSLDELARIYRGDVIRWPNGERIRPVLRPETETDTQLVKRMSLAMSSAMDAARNRPGMLMATTDQDCIDIIEKTPGSLGFSTLAQVLSEKHNIKVLAVNGIVPSTTSLAAGNYPVAKTLSLVMTSDLSAAGRKFVDFIFSPQGNKVLRETGNMPLPKAAAR